MTATITPSARTPGAAGTEDIPDPAAGPTARRRRPGWRTAAEVAGALILSCAAELPLLRVFGHPGVRLIALTVPGATVAAAAVRAGLGRLVRDQRSPLPVIAGFAAGLVGGAGPGMLLAAADPFGPAALAPRLDDAVRDGWRRLLSVPVPVPDTRSFTDLPVLLAALLAALVVLVTLSTRPAAALIPATLGFGGLLTLGVHGPGSGVVLSGAFALAALTFLLLAARSAVLRGTATAVSVTAVVAAAALGVMVAHPGAPYDPRAKVRIPLSVQVSQDPLALLSARLEQPGTPVLRATLSGALLTHPRNWVVLAYEDYDGAGWQAEGSARPTETSAAAPGSIGTGTATVTADTATALLPHPANVLGDVPQDLGYDADAEMLVSPQALTHYTVQVSVTEPGVAALDNASIPASAPAVLTQVPSCVPAYLRELAARVKQVASLPGQEAVMLQNVLRSAPFRYDQGAPPGEGCGSIGLLTDHGGTYAKGTSAQFATAFVLAARLMGLPARIVAGYLPGKLSGDTETVTDADAFAWPQVLLTGVGWVDFDPTPTAGSSAVAPAREKQPNLTKVRVAQPGGTKGTAPRVVTPTPAPPAPGVPAWVWALLAVVAAAALTVTWLGAVWLVAWRRRNQRRRAAAPAERVLGAWDELLIPLGQAGASISGCSAPRVAESAAGIVPSEAQSVGQLAVLAERALYDRIGEPDVATAWQLSDRARGAVAAAVPRRARLRGAFGLRRRGR
jgi:transglutaminase-like putative cysteine protease